MAASDPELTARLAQLVAQGEAIEAEGLPFPTAQIRTAVERALSIGERGQATTLLKRGEALYARAARDWVWLRELLQRVDELRDVALRIGLDVAHLETRVGNPREQLRTSPLSAGGLERSAAAASLALAILNDAIPKYCVEEGRKLGEQIRGAKKRGEEVSEATSSFGLLLHSIPEGHATQTAEQLLEVRRAVARIPRASALSGVPSEEEEEILLEARNLARRLHRMKGRARNAQSAARLMAEVRAALSEDRRYGTPEEEIEALWSEVDRLTKERIDASTGAEAAMAIGYPGSGAPTGPPPGAVSEEPVDEGIPLDSLVAQRPEPGTVEEDAPGVSPPEPTGDNPAPPLFERERPRSRRGARQGRP